MSGTMIVYLRILLAYDGYPFATVSVFLARSSERQQYQLATEA